MLDACLPFGPWVTSKETFCPSLSVLNPFMLIAEKWANRSSPPSSGVMKPYPLASLNHLTVPVAICVFSLQKVVKAVFCLVSRYYRKHSLSGTHERTNARQTSTADTLIQTALLYAYVRRVVKGRCKKTPLALKNLL